LRYVPVVYVEVVVDFLTALRKSAESAVGAQAVELQVCGSSRHGEGYCGMGDVDIMGSFVGQSRGASSNNMGAHVCMLLASGCDTTDVLCREPVPVVHLCVVHVSPPPYTPCTPPTPAAPGRQRLHLLGVCGPEQPPHRQPRHTGVPAGHGRPAAG
jgi:uncharacterized low-complexity protein